jgi:uncharacterized protein
MKKFLSFFLCLCFNSPFAFAATVEANLEIESPTIAVIKKSIAGRLAVLKPRFESRSIGLTRDGLVAIMKPDNIHPTERRTVEILVEEDNKDRATLYREIARANGRPDWEADLKRTFGERWINRAPMGWMIEDAPGIWKKK